MCIKPTNIVDPLPAEILLIDDDRVNVLLLKSVLQAQSFAVITATTGEKGIQNARTMQPDIILLDVVMPGIDGFEVCHRLKEDPQTQNIPIIFMTAATETAAKVKGLELGAVDYITKPIEPAEVIARINTHLTMRRLQQGLEHEIEERGKLIDELDAFAHTVAHDLKGPLGTIIGFSELLGDNTGNNISPEKFRTAVKAISISGRKMQNIIDGLLTLSTVRREQAEVQEPLNMKHIIDETRARLIFAIDQNNAQLQIQDKWPTAVGIPSWIEEVWANYLSNAIKYGGTPPRIQLGATELDNDMVKFWIKDNGNGIPDEAYKSLFTPFTRLNQVKVKGHGLGLSIVQRIVTRLGGEVGVHSEVGQGSTFYFTLPKTAKST